MGTKKWLCAAVAVIFAVVLTACGGGADQEFVEWSDANVDVIESRIETFVAAIEAAGYDLAAMIALTEPHLAFMTDMRDSLARIDRGELNSENQRRFDENMSLLQEEIDEYTAMLAILRPSAGLVDELDGLGLDELDGLIDELAELIGELEGLAD